MKRIPALICIAAAFFILTACTAFSGEKAKVQPGLDVPFSADIKMTYGDNTAEANIKRIGSGTWQVLFSSPKTLDGIELTFSDNNVSASYKGLSFSVPQSAVPVKSMLGEMFSIIDNTAKSSEVEVIKENDLMMIKDKTDTGDYTLKFDAGNGKIVSFEMPNLGLVIEFLSFSTGDAAVTTSVTGITTDGTDMTTASEESGAEANAVTDEEVEESSEVTGTTAQTDDDDDNE